MTENMQDEPVFQVTPSLFKQLEEWQEKMEQEDSKTANSNVEQKEKKQEETPEK